MTREEIDRRICLLLDHEISAAEFDELQAQLRESPEVRDQYRRLTELHSLLAGEAQVTMQAPWSMGRTLMDRVSIATRRRAVVQACLAAAAVIMLAGVVMWMIWVSESAPMLTYRSTPATKIEITHAPSGKRAPQRHEAAMVKGSRIRIESGFVELNFASGVRSILRGPGEWTLVERDVLAMRGGTAWFEVPADEAGFKVRTGIAEITDLGTEFGIVAANGSSDEEVHVFKGRVEVLTDHADERLILNAGTARRIDAIGGMHAIEANPGRFFTSLPETLPYLHLSFDQLVDGRFEVQGNHPAAAEIEARPMQMAGRPASSRLVEGVRGKALAFDGEADYLLTDWPGIAGDAPRTVVMWVRFPPGARQLWDGAGMAWGTRVAPSLPVCWKFNFRASAANGGGHLKPGAPAVVHAGFGRWWCSGTTNLADGQWHGIAVTYSGETDENDLPDVKLYVNGEIEPHHATDDRRSQLHRPIEIDTRIDGPDATPMILGRTQKRVGAKNPERAHHYFEGEIDEVFIFEGVLGPDEIRRLHRDKRFQPPNAEK